MNPIQKDFYFTVILHHIDIRNKFNQYIDAEIVIEPMRKLLLSINNHKFMESLEISIKQD